MNQLILCLLVLSTALCSRLWAEDDSVYRQSVVKIFSTGNQLNLSSPWKRGPGNQSTGTGIWIGGRRILTNEHLVDYATQISIQPYESADRLPAEVIFVSPEMDLAIIELDDPLFTDVPAPRFSAELPQLRSKVRVYGFPEGGRSLSVTEGIVSRIEYRPYSYGEFGLRVQVDAAINPGNSGGPVYVDDQIIGIAFQKRARADNIGYLIPSEEVLRFLKNAEQRKNERKPELPMVFQRLQNRNLRVSLGLDSGTSGVWVRDLVSPPDGYPVEVGDVVTHIGNHAIDNSGQARLGENVLVGFEYFVPQLVQDGAVPLRLIRNGEEMEVAAPVRSPRRMLLPALKGTYPPYFVYGPLVFIAAPGDFVGALEAMARSSNAATRVKGIVGLTALSRKRNPLITRRFDQPGFEDEELVMVCNWLPHRIGVGYQSPNMQVVKAINGIRINNLIHLVETLRDQASEYVEFEFEDKRVEKLVFNREQLEQATEEILLNNGIPRQGTRDLLKVWNVRGERSGG